MSVLFFDGLQPYGNVAHMIGRWSGVTTAKTLVSEGSFPTGRALEVGNGVAVTTTSIRMDLPSATDEIIIGMYLRRMTALGTSVRNIFTLQNAAGEQLFRVEASSAGFFVRDSHDTELGELTTLPTTAVYYEFKVKLSDDEYDVGTVTIMVDGAEEFTFEGDTCLRADKQCTQVRIGGIIGGALNTAWTLRFGHFYVLSVDESIAGDFLGAPSIEYRAPESDIEVAWEPSDMYADNFEMVDDAEADEDTSYVVTDLPALDIYGIAPFNLIEGFHVLAVQLHSIQRIDGVGSGPIHHVLRGDYEDFESPEILVSGSDYLSAATLHELNPDTGLEWDRTELDLLQAGILSPAEY